MSRAIFTILLLVCSNTFMTLAWYGQIIFKSKFERLGLFAVIVVSWIIAFFEYSLMVPANRIGSSEFGGPFNLWELKVLQEVISITVFATIVLFFAKTETLRWNHIAGFCCLILAVYFIFKR